jgi:hypothetical protein
MRIRLIWGNHEPRQRDEEMERLCGSSLAVRVDIDTLI